MSFETSLWEIKKRRAFLAGSSVKVQFHTVIWEKRLQYEFRMERHVALQSNFKFFSWNGGSERRRSVTVPRLVPFVLVFPLSFPPITSMWNSTCDKNRYANIFSKGNLLLFKAKKLPAPENRMHHWIERGKWMRLHGNKPPDPPPLIQEDPLKLLKEKWGRKSAGKISMFLRVDSLPFS